MSTTTGVANISLYLVPEDLPINLLDCAAAFAKLTDNEKKYAHFLSKASWEGGKIVYQQVSEESSKLFSLFQKLFTTFSVSDLKSRSSAAGVSEREFGQFLSYVAAFYGNSGNYLSFGDSKFIPRLEVAKFETIVASSGDREISELFERVKQKLYSLNQNELSLGLEDKGVSTYYSPGIRKEEIDFVQAFLQSNSISPLNTRLFKKAEKHFELKIASAHVRAPEVFVHEGTTIEVGYGDFHYILQEVANNLKLAIPYAANQHQSDMLAAYVEHFLNGDIEAHKQSQRHWIKDIGPVVESNIGFIETYRDPLGVRAEFEGLVAIVNKQMSAKFGKLVDGAPSLLPLLPWPKEYEKEKFQKPDFTSLEVLTFASSGVPAGINIPNYDDIREVDGFKNVSLGNVLSAAGPTEKATFLRSEDQLLYEKYRGPSFEVQVALHELLGHGSGKLFTESANGKFNFDLETINPLTGAKVSSWYKPGETWDSKFGALSSTMEECRAECVGVYLCSNPQVLAIFGHDHQTVGDVSDVTYVNWLNMVRAGFLALEFYSPDSAKWRQAHMQARFAIFQTLLRAGQGLLHVQQDNGSYSLVLERSKILSVAQPAVGEFLKKINIWKACADQETARAYYTELTTPNEEYLSYREVVLANKRPRKVFVQCNTTLSADGDVKLIEYPATAEGMIQSFVDRYGKHSVI